MKQLSKAQIEVLRYASKGYNWIKLPEVAERPPELKRAFNRRTIARLNRLGLIRYRPATYYLTRKGRKALKSWNKV